MAETKQRFIAFVGPSYTSRSQRFDAQRLVNMYLEINELGAGKGGEPAVMLSTPGLNPAQLLGTGPIRATYTISDQELTYVVSGVEVYQITGPNSIPVKLTGNLGSSSGPIAISDNGIQVLFSDGVSGYYITIGTSTVNLVNDPNFYPCATITFQDGYFICNQTGTANFFISDLYSIDFLPLNQAAKSGNSDILMGVISNNRQLFLLGARSFETWYDQGASGSTPFSRQDGRFSQVGCAAPASIKVLGETFFWVGTNAQGGAIVYALTDSSPQRVSTHAVEYALEGLNIAQATAWTYQQEGHYFYCLNVPGAVTTWCYDVSAAQWAERQSFPSGFAGRHIAETHCFINGIHMVGDYRNGQLYTLDLEYCYDNLDVIHRIRQCPDLSSSLNRMFYKLLEIDMQMGTGLVDDGTNTAASVDPQITLYISDDGGETWGLPQSASFGKIGKYKTRVRFQRLGSAYARVFRLVSTEPVKTTILSAYMDVEIGQA